IPQVAQERVEDCRAGVADFEAAGPGAMAQLEPVGFDLQERLVAGQFLGRLAARRQHKASRRTRLDFLKQFLHARFTLGAKPAQRKYLRNLVGRAVFVKLANMALAPDPDAALMLCVKQGDTDAFAVLVD